MKKYPNPYNIRVYHVNLNDDYSDKNYNDNYIYNYNGLTINTFERILIVNNLNMFYGIRLLKLKKY